MSELKKAVNTVTGITRELGPHIYNNRFRMKSGNWQLIETPDPIDTDMIPVMANVPTRTIIVEANEDYIKEHTVVVKDTEIPEVTEPIQGGVPMEGQPEIPEPLKKYLNKIEESIPVIPTTPTATKPKPKNK